MIGVKAELSITIDQIMDIVEQYIEDGLVKFEHPEGFRTVTDPDGQVFMHTDDCLVFHIAVMQATVQCVMRQISEDPDCVTKVSYIDGSDSTFH